MQIIDAAFDDASIERHGTAAGVLPFTTTPNGEVYVLLGRERFVHSWRGSCRWSGFEGSRHRGESIDETAVREFVEESLGVIVPHMSPHLLRTQYDFRVVMRVTGDRFPLERYHATYAWRLPSRTQACVETFTETRGKIEHIDRLAQEWQFIRPTAFGHMNADVVSRVEGEDACHVRLSTLLGEHTERVTLHGRAAAEAILWEKLRTRLTERIAALSHECVVARFDEQFDRLQAVQIEREHLEKDRIRWWSASELKIVLADRGVMGMERFRPYFLPVLQTFLHHIAPVRLSLAHQLALPRQGRELEATQPEQPLPTAPPR